MGGRFDAVGCGGMDLTGWLGVGIGGGVGWPSSTAETRLRPLLARNIHTFGTRELLLF